MTNKPNWRANVDQSMFAAQDAELARKAKVPLTAEKIAAQQLTRARTLRALDAIKQEKVAPRPKRERQRPPIVQKRFIQPTSTEHLRDQRLCPGARVALTIVIGLLGNKNRREITVGGIAAAVGVTKRSARRYLAALERLGYISRSLVHNVWGVVTGGVISLLVDIRPRTKRKKTAETPKNVDIIERTVKSSINPTYSYKSENIPRNLTKKRRYLFPSTT